MVDSIFIIHIAVKRLCNIYFSVSCVDILFVLILTQIACSLSDIDECSEAHIIKMNECHRKASCIYTQGSYNCSCYPEYTGNGFNCKGAVGFCYQF